MLPVLYLVMGLNKDAIFDRFVNLIPVYDFGIVSDYLEHDHDHDFLRVDPLFQKEMFGLSHLHKILTSGP